MEGRYKYYQNMKSLALDVREKYSINNFRVMPSQLKGIIKSEGVEHIDLRDFTKIRGLYCVDDYGAHIAVRRGLPTDPYAFTLAHELKHHLVDQDLGQIICYDEYFDDVIEIGAEIFAAEMLFPEADFQDLLSHLGVKKGACCPEDIVVLKKETQTTLSYSGLAKRAKYLEFAKNGVLDNVRWRELEYKLFGVPFYMKRKIDLSI